MKKLQILQQAWENCRACDLGVRRAAEKESFVFGEGALNGIMFIGDGPGAHEEEEGRPFIGKSGELLRTILAGYQFTKFYLTNIVSCRSCVHAIDDTGTPIFRKYKGKQIPLLRDETPKKHQMEACKARLQEEIYLVDPVLIVTLGVATAEFVIDQKISITKDRGKTFHCTVPGKLQTAILTEKKKAWERKVKGKVVRPTKQSDVRYVVLPTLHPSFVLRKLSDHGTDSPWNLLASDVKKAIEIYEFIKGDQSLAEKEFDHGEECETN